jgi:hypothetical protein
MTKGRLYYHKTDGGAEYLCTKRVRGTKDEGDCNYTVVRLDGKPEARGKLYVLPDLIEALEEITAHCIYMNNMQHAGQEMLAVDWSVLYGLQNKAKAALVSAGVK